MSKVLAVLFLLASIAGGWAAEPAIPQPNADFFTRLRLDYSQRKDFNPVWKVDEEREAILVAARAKDQQKVFELSGRWLTKCPVDADIHALRSAAATSLNDIKSYVHHLYFAYGLMQSVMQSGDGLTPKTAFKVISVAEEYSVLREFGAEVQRQTLTEGPCDKMDCQYPDGKIVTLYFDVSIPMKAFNRELK